MFDASNKLSQSVKKKSRIKFSWSNLGQSLSYLLDLGTVEFKSIFRITRNYGRWSVKVTLKLPDTILGKTVLEKILSINVLELLFSLVGCSIWGRK